jgi:hypothetical protein
MWDVSMMKPSVYIETTIPSYLTAWRSPELIMAANQEATRSWWESSRPRYDLFISAIVTQEASGGDPEAAARRVASVEGLPELDLSEEVELLELQAHRKRSHTTKDRRYLQSRRI